jgi:DNA-binding SARP family transcriptional activator
VDPVPRGETVEVWLLGHLAVHATSGHLGPDALGGRKPKQLLELLALARGRPVTKERLIDLLWPERPPRSPVPALENHVWVLRRHLRDALPEGANLVAGEAGAYRLATEHVTLDLDRLDTLLATARRSSGAARRRYLEEACSLDRGDLLADEPYAEWAQAPRAIYRARLTDAHLDLADDALAAGQPAAALGPATTALQREPLSDRGCRLVMRCFAAIGDRARALATFETFRTGLVQELGVEPDAATIELAERLRAGLGPRSVRSDLPARAADIAGPVLVAPRSDGPADPAGGSATLALHGRTGEIERLAAAIVGTLDDGGGSLLVEGLAHVGKSAAVAAALAVARDRRPPLQHGWTAFPAPLTGLTDVLVLAAVREAVGSPADARPGTTNDRLEVAADLLRHHVPVALVLDDLHLGERDEVVRALVRLRAGCAGAPVALIGVFRTEEVAYHHPLRLLWARHQQVIDPLPAVELVHLGGAAAYTWTGGYGAYLAAWPTSEHGQPARELVQAVLGRCAAAGPRAYRLLLAASVLAEPVTLAALARATNLRLGRVAEDVDELCGRGLLRDVGTGGYAFTATLVREVLRGQTSALRREVVLASSSVG